HGLRQARLEEQREVDPGGHEHDEGIERHLAEQERPVVGEDVAQRLAQERRGAAAAIEELDAAADHDGLPGPRRWVPHQAGPTGPEKFPAARRLPWGSISSGSWGSGRPAGPKITSAPRAGSNVE